MGRIIKVLSVFAILVLGCSEIDKEDIDNEIFFLQASLDCAYLNFTLQESYYLENKNSKGEVIEKINKKLKFIIDNDYLIRMRFTTLIEERNISNFRKSELIERLDYFKESTKGVLDKDKELKFDTFLDNAGYYKGITSKYKNDKELNVMLLKKYLIVRLATLEAIQYIYS